MNNHGPLRHVMLRPVKGVPVGFSEKLGAVVQRLVAWWRHLMLPPAASRFAVGARLTTVPRSWSYAALALRSPCFPISPVLPAGHDSRALDIPARALRNRMGATTDNHCALRSLASNAARRFRRLGYQLPDHRASPTRSRPFQTIHARRGLAFETISEALTDRSRTPGNPGYR